MTAPFTKPELNFAKVTLNAGHDDLILIRDLLANECAKCHEQGRKDRADWARELHNKVNVALYPEQYAA